MGNRLKTFLDAEATAAFSRLGYSDRMIREAKREAWWWAKARGRALAERRPLLRGSAVAWTEPGSCELLAVEEPVAGRGKVTIEIAASAVSPGTERAQYLRLPNAQVRYPYRPGYSAAGTVVKVGPAAGAFRAGDRVALATSHCSLATVAVRSVYPIPAGVELAHASLVQLGIIAGHGVERAAITAGEPICVVGCGLVGALAQRIAQTRGAGAATVIAASRRKQHVAEAGGASAFIALDEDEGRIDDIAAPVVIEATGDPDAILVALRAAGVGGRVVLLGSPRGATADLSLTEIKRKRLTLVGAHISTLGAGSTDRRRAYQDQASAFLGGLAEGRIDVADLVERRVDPRDAPAFYRELAYSRDIMGAYFDWPALERSERRRRSRMVRVPDLRARGVDYGQAPLPTSRRRSWERDPLLASADPFAGARGRLRFGLLGCGDIAGQNAAAISAAPNAELVVCYDPVETLAAGLARAHGAEMAPSVEAVLDRRDVDAVFLAVPHHLHAPLAQRAVEAGVHVIVEKPPANDLGSAAVMVAAARRSGVRLSVCFPQRYHPAVAASQRLIAAGMLGDFAGSLLTFLTARPPSYWVGGLRGKSASSWRASRAQAGGGVLIMNLSHHIDLTHFLLGIEAETVTALESRDERIGDVEDTISVSVRYANGAVGSIFGSTAVPGTGEGRSSSDFRLWGRDGHISLLGGVEAFTLRSVDGLRPGRWQTMTRASDVQTRAIYVSRFATAVAEGTEPDVSIEDALAVQAFIEAAYRSSETNVPVRPAELLREAVACST
jgi:2-desacetyl-2-hydroxyethyl bacteriochlorophyllide A dehydrogenase